MTAGKRIFDVCGAVAGLLFFGPMAGRCCSGKRDWAAIVDVSRS